MYMYQTGALLNKFHERKSSGQRSLKTVPLRQADYCEFHCLQKTTDLENEMTIFSTFSINTLNTLVYLFSDYLKYLIA